MKKYLVSFGGSEQGKNRHNESFGIHRNYTAEVERLFNSAKGQVDSCIAYDNDWLIKSEYYKKYKQVLDCPSFGWLFKPISVLHTMNSIQDQDIILWLDSNDIVIGDLSPIFKFATTHGFYFHDHHPAVYHMADWAHRDMFIGMGCDEPRYWTTIELQVNVFAIQKTKNSMRFVRDWVEYGGDYHIMIANKHENLRGFIAHRHEQALASILKEKYKIPYAIGYPDSITKELPGIPL
jgi:hypothetical protein